MRRNWNCFGLHVLFNFFHRNSEKFVKVLEMIVLQTYLYYHIVGYRLAVELKRFYGMR